MRLALLTTDNREHYKDYGAARPYFGTAPEALLQGLALLPGLEVHVLSCARARLEPTQQLAPNVFFHSLHVPKFGWMTSGYQGCIRAVRRKLAQLQPDIVHGQGTERECAIGAVFSGYPNVVTIHGNMAELARLAQARVGSFGWLAARLENFTLKRTAGVFCNSAYTEGLVRPRARKTWRVPNALRQPFFLPGEVTPRRDKCLLLNVGIISPRKRQCEILALAGNLHRQGLAFELRFIGDANPEDSYAARFLKAIREAEGAGFATYFPAKPVAELIRCFDQSDGLVHFPYEEAFGLVVAEALARGLQLFAARVGGITEIAAGVPGAELFGPEDWGGLEQALGRWIRDGYCRAPEASVLMRARYSPSTIAQRHLDIYREVLGVPSRAS